MESNIIQRINSALSTMTKTQLKIAKYVLKDPFSASFASVKSLADAVNVSPTSVFRFAQDFSGDGYQAFQDELRSYLSSESKPGKRFLMNALSSQNEDPLLASVYETQLKNLEETYNSNLIFAIKQASNLILSAKHVYTCGSRNSFTVAYYLGHNLNRALDNVDIIQDDYRIIDTIRRITKDDVVIITSLPRHSGHMLTVAQLLYEKKVPTVIITGDHSSPFVAFSEYPIFVAYTSNDFHNSLVSAIFVSDMLISSVSLKNSQTTLNKLDETEVIFDAFKQSDTKRKRH